MKISYTTQVISLCTTLFFTLLIYTYSYSQSHNFPMFNPGQILSNNAGITNNLPVSGVAGDYLVYTVEADYVGSGNAQTSWSSTVHLEINNGAGTILRTGSKADAGSFDNGNATVLKWSGLINKKYVGGTSLSTRFYDDYDDASGPYISNLSNVKISIFKADNQNTFPTVSPGALSSGNPGVLTSLDPTGISGNHLLYVITADFMGVGGAQSAWSSTIEMTLTDGAGTIIEPEARATSGGLDNISNTTLTWTGIISKEYVGGDNISINFRDDYHDASGPYTCNISNVVVEIFRTVEPVDFPIVQPGPLNSGNMGTSTPLNTSGVALDHLFYIVTADFEGTGGAQTAWSNSIEMGINNNGSLTYEDLRVSDIGAMDNGNPTTLIWSGSFSEEYVGGSNLAIQFFDNYNDAAGPYTSNINNVQLRTYPVANVTVPVELISFKANHLKYEFNK